MARVDGSESGPEGDSAEFLEQARWLLEWHNRRGEAIATRATAALGFVGVVLALLLQAATLDGFQPRWWTWAALGSGLLLLLAAGMYALLTVLPAQTQMPSVGQLRHWWSEQIADPEKGMTAAQIAESILFGLDTNQDSPISDALNGANSRARWFKLSAVALLCAFIPITALTVDVLVRIER